MKKIYTLIAGIVFSGTIIGQDVLEVPDHSTNKGNMSLVNLPVTGIRDQSRSTFAAWVEPVGDIMRTLGIDLTGQITGTSEGHFAIPIFQDSTVVYSDASGAYPIYHIMKGSILDPQSPDLQTSLVPYVTPTQSYYLDSLIIKGSYVKVTPAIDTLYTWIVWGDTTNSSVAFTKRATSASWVPPISTWRYEIIGPKVTGSANGSGNIMNSAVPATNMKLINKI